jgi:hypothetical protein
MQVDARRTLKQQAHHILPGLIHFSALPLRLSPLLTKVKAIRIGIPEMEILNLAAVRLEGPSQEAINSATVVVSSQYKGSREARALLQGASIHTNAELNPYWQITFEKPAEVRHIEIDNRTGVWGARSYGICVTICTQDGSLRTYDNTAANTLLQRLGEFRVRAADLLRYLDSLTKAERAPVQGEITTIRNLTAVTVGAVEAALAGTVADPGEAHNRRMALLQAGDAVLAKLDAKHSRAVIRLVADFSHWLLDRTNRPKTWKPSDTELAAIGTIFTDHFIAKDSVSLRQIQENQAFLQERESAISVEDRVNDLYLRATGDSASLPIMFRTHGMRAALLNMNKDAVISSMKEISEVLSSLGYPAAICYGTLLGAVRTGTFIPHDDDVDMAMVVKSTRDEDLDAELKSLVEALKAQGVFSYIMPGQKFLKVRALKGGQNSDVFPIIVQDDSTVRMYMERLAIRDVPKNCVLPFSQMEFYGETFATPADREAFLTQRYGETWRIPQRVVGSVIMEA